MHEKVKAVVDALKGAATHAVTSVSNPRKFAREFFELETDGERRWFDLLALIVAFVAVVICTAYLGAGPDKSLPAPPWIVGCVVLTSTELAFRTTLVHGLLRLLKGRAVFSRTLQSIAFPGFTAASVGIATTGFFHISGHVGFLWLAGVVTLALGVVPSIVILSTVHGISLRRASVAFLAQGFVFGGLALLAVATRSEPLRLGITPQREEAMAILDCVDSEGRGRKSRHNVLVPELTCVPCEKIPLSDGGYALHFFGDAGVKPLAEIADAGHHAYCRDFKLSPQQTKRIEEARSCVTSVKVTTHAAVRLKRDALAYLADLEAISVDR